MGLTDPITAYNAESNMEAMLVQRFLESEGIEAYATEDLSLAGYWALGTLPEIHKPQVWINRRDAARVAQLLVEFEHRKLERDATRKAEESTTIESRCEDCGKTATFAGSLKDTVQNCPHCSAYMDIGEIGWPADEDFGIAKEDTDDDSSAQ